VCSLDHPEIKLPLCQRFTELFERNATRVCYFGNVTVGKDVSVAELQQIYHAVVLATGANRDKRLGIPGESLRGIYSARHFVYWYNGFPFGVFGWERERERERVVHSPSTQFTSNDVSKHNKSDNEEFYERDEKRETELVHRLTTESVAHIIGLGNVALDVARMLLQPIDGLRHTDVTQSAFDVLKQSAIREVHIFARRGPLQVACTTKELREVTRLEGCTVLLAEPLQLTDSDREELNSRPKQRLFQLLQSLQQSVLCFLHTISSLSFAFIY
jgi:adrenodoxin-NADP+ reductase